MGNSTKPDPLREDGNIAPIPMAPEPHESATRTSANVPAEGTVGMEAANATSANAVEGLRDMIGEQVAAGANVVSVDFGKPRKGSLKSPEAVTKSFRSDVPRPANDARDGSAGAGMEPLNAEVASHPDEDEISQFPVLVEFLENMDKGYETIANVFCKMRIALRELMVESGVWEGVSNEMPDSRNWYEPITLDNAVKRLERDWMDLGQLADRASDPKLSDEVQDLAYDQLFGIVAQTILMMERRFLRYKFDDEFIQSICDQLIESLGQTDKGIRQLIVQKLGPDYDLFMKKQAEQRWGTVKVVSSDVTSASPRSGTGGPRLVVYEDPDTDK